MKERQTSEMGNMPSGPPTEQAADAVRARWRADQTRDLDRARQLTDRWVIVPGPVSADASDQVLAELGPAKSARLSQVWRR
jgi:hypothetical protein